MSGCNPVTLNRPRQQKVGLHATRAAELMLPCGCTRHSYKVSAGKLDVWSRQATTDSLRMIPVSPRQRHTQRTKPSTCVRPCNLIMFLHAARYCPGQPCTQYF